MTPTPPQPPRGPNAPQCPQRVTLRDSGRLWTRKRRVRVRLAAATWRAMRCAQRCCCSTLSPTAPGGTLGTSGGHRGDIGGMRSPGCGDGHPRGQQVPQGWGQEGTPRGHQMPWGWGQQGHLWGQTPALGTGGNTLGDRKGTPRGHQMPWAWGREGPPLGTGGGHPQTGTPKGHHMP